MNKNQLDNIFYEIHTLIENNYGAMKSIEYYLDKKIRYQISINQSESRKKLSLFSINKLITTFKLSKEECETIIDQIEELIYDNKIRSDEINGKFLFDVMDENLKSRDEYGI